MIRIKLQLEPDGCLRRLQSDGHASGETQPNIVCAAATMVMRSVARVLVAQSDIVVNGTVPSEGTLTIGVQSCPGNRREWLSGVTQVLVSGLVDLADEFPQQVRLDITSDSLNRQGEKDGT